MMNIYVYAESAPEYFPELHSIIATSYHDAVEKLVNHYRDKFNDDEIDFNSMEELQDYLNDKYTIAISDLEDKDEL